MMERKITKISRAVIIIFIRIRIRKSFLFSEAEFRKIEKKFKFFVEFSSKLLTCLQKSVIIYISETLESFIKNFHRKKEKKL